MITVRGSDKISDHHKDAHFSHPTSLRAKVCMRKKVCEHIPRPRVLDAFCGVPTGSMWDLVWRDRSEAYVGIDVVWDFDDPRRRYVADNRTVLRTLDLHAFNVFDLDAFGSPWEQAYIIAKRRRWGAKETGALLITDGAVVRTRQGKLDTILKVLPGLDTGIMGRGAGASSLTHAKALNAILDMMGVVAIRRWHAKKKTQTQVHYTAVVFAGKG